MALNPTRIARVVRAAVPAGARIPSSQARAVVNDIRRQAGAAVDIVGEITQLGQVPSVHNIPVFIVDRANWAKLASESVANMLTTARISNTELAIAFAVMAPRLLGQYDPYTDAGRLIFVAPNIERFQRAFQLNQSDVCLWAAVHEMTHAYQFAVAPWLAPMIAHYTQQIIESAHDEQIIEQAMTAMSVLEGHAEYVMNRVPHRQLPSRDRIIRAMSARRSARTPMLSRVMRLLGFENKTQQYISGERFVAGVIQKAGMDTFNMLWNSADHMPTAAELADPALWIERMS
ncbi:zinc-dependent metalloprotease [Trueperella sp. LYQ143]|uniref:zinc-dependent metalloprotease n=1 Tax=Trueperella sp. LYQ143 TaxID=3391059 RepID=UPI0039830BB6